MIDAESGDKLRSNSLSQHRSTRVIVQKRSSTLYRSVINAIDQSILPSKNPQNDAFEQYLSQMTDTLELDSSYSDNMQQSVKKIKELQAQFPNDYSNVQQKYKFQLYSSLVTRNLFIRKCIMNYIQVTKSKGKYTLYSIIRSNPKPQTAVIVEPSSRNTRMAQPTQKFQRSTNSAQPSLNQTTSQIRVPSAQTSDTQLKFKRIDPDSPVKHRSTNLQFTPRGYTKLVAHHFSEAEQSHCPVVSTNSSPNRPMPAKHKLLQSDQSLPNRSCFISHLTQVQPQFPPRHLNIIRLLQHQNQYRPSSTQKSSHLLQESRTIKLTFDSETHYQIHKRQLSQKIDRDFYYKLLGKIYERNVAAIT